MTVEQFCRAVSMRARGINTKLDNIQQSPLSESILRKIVNYQIRSSDPSLTKDEVIFLLDMLGISSTLSKIIMESVK